MEKKILCFDLDGTIMKTDPGIDAAHRFALKTLALDYELPKNQHYLYIGPSNSMFCRETLRMSDEHLIKEYDDLFCTYYLENGLSMCHPYPGMIALMHDARAAGYQVYICTAKAEDAATSLAKKEGFYDVCNGIYGAFGAADEKVDLLTRLIQTEGLDPAQIIMIGDRYTDLDAGKACHTGTIGVAYGYAQPGELENCKPDYIANDVEDLRLYLLDDEVMEHLA